MSAARKTDTQAVVNNNTKGHKYGYQEAGGEQQNTAFKTSDFQYNPGNFCYEIVENSSYTNDDGKAFRQLNKNRYKPLGITGKDNYRRSPAPDQRIPDFGELKKPALTGEEERYRLTGFKHRATFSIPRDGTDSKMEKPQKLITGE